MRGTGDPERGKSRIRSIVFIHGIEELEAEVLSAGFVPSTGEAILSVRLVFKLNAGIHRVRSSASARRRTSSQGTPADSPAITRRARRSISAAHAASTSAGFSVSASSRLARSSAATSARSATGKAKASRRTSCAREFMKPFYTLARQPTSRWRRRRRTDRPRRSLLRAVERNRCAVGPASEAQRTSSVL